MGYYFAPYQLADIAIEIEESGVYYYAELVKRTSDENAKKIFQFLSEQEILHKKSFEMIKSQSKEAEQEREYAIDLIPQMKVLADDIRKSIEGFLSENPQSFHLKEAFDIGIQTETKSIQAYTMMKDQLIDMFAVTLSKIIKQEEGHLETLMELKAKSL